jgi:drug/metabolite transporter (DMT)-like permease
VSGRSPADSALAGIALFLAAMLCFSGSDALAKLLSAGLPVIEIAAIRYAVFVPFAAFVLMRDGGRFRTAQPILQILRGLALVGTALFFTESLRSLPIATAATISFTSPAMITVLAVLVLRERVGWRRWLALLIGMIGVVVVIRPGTAAFHPAALWTVASSLAWAIAIIITRKMSAGHAPSTLLWSAMTGVILLGGLLPFVAVWPSATEIALCLALGVLASMGQYLMILAYRSASASLLAPFSYTQLLWAIITGYVAFGAAPDLLTLIGGAVIAGSGIWSARNERHAASLVATNSATVSQNASISAAPTSRLRAIMPRRAR